MKGNDINNIPVREEESAGELCIHPHLQTPSSSRSLFDVPSAVCVDMRVRVRASVRVHPGELPPL